MRAPGGPPWRARPGGEPSGTVAVQAMACWKLVVLPAVGVDRDVVTDGMTGALVPPQRPLLLACRCGGCGSARCS